MNRAAGRTFPWRVRQRRAAEAVYRELSIWTAVAVVGASFYGRSDPVAIAYTALGIVLLHAVAIQFPYRRALSRGDDRKLADFAVNGRALLLIVYAAATAACAYAHYVFAPRDRGILLVMVPILIGVGFVHVRRMRRLRLERLVLRRGRHMGTSAFAGGDRARAGGALAERRPATAYRLRRQRREAYRLSAELLTVLFVVGAAWALALAASFVAVGPGLALGILAALAALIVLAALWLTRVARPGTRATAVLDFVIVHRACLCCAYVVGSGALLLGGALLAAESGPGALVVVALPLIPFLPITYRHRRGWNRARLERIVIESRAGGGVGSGHRAGVG